MNEQFLHSKISSMEMDVLTALKQRTLEKFTAGPSVDRARLFFLMLPYFTGKPWSEETEASARTVSIVYAALQAHDLVRESAPVTREQQLTVLAGDFYSGIYYQMLSNINNIQLIRGLATGVITVSEQKATFYENLVQPENRIVRSFELIETELIAVFYRHYGYEEYLELAKLVLNYSGYAKQLAQHRLGHETILIRSLNRSLTYPMYTERWLLDKLDLLYDEILSNLDKGTLTYDLKNYLLHQLTPHHHLAEQLTREG